MQRHPAFHALSSEHHQALVVAHRILKILAEPPPAAALGELAREVAEDMQDRWERHFACEERLFDALPSEVHERLAPLLERILAEHRAMRGLVPRLEAGDTGALAELAGMLRDHTRLEERQLLPALEEALPPSTLAALGHAWAACGGEAGV